MSDNPLNTVSPGRPKDMAKRQAILESAKSLFLDKGYANTSMDAVALAFLQRFAEVTALAAEAGAAVTEGALPDDAEGSRNGPF